MEIKLYFRMLQRSWWIIILTALAAVATTLIISYFTTPIYRATSRFVVSPSAQFVTGGNNVVNSLDTLDKRSIITTYAEVLKSPRIYQDTLTLLHMNAVDLTGYSINSVVLTDSNIIEFSVQGPNPGTTALLTNSIGQQAVKYVQGLYQVYDMNLLDPAFIPVTPISPQPIRDSAVAIVIGLGVGIALALVRELLRTPIENFLQQRNIDSLSGALNQSSFNEILLDVSFASAKDFSLCMLHLEGLHDYINVLPQPTLEKILRHVTQTLRNQLRGNDLVGRWGEADFSVLLSETTGDAALNTMGRVQAALVIPIKIDVSGEDLSLNPQIGIAEYRVGDTAKSLLQNTNWALEIAKKDKSIYLLKATEPL